MLEQSGFVDVRIGPPADTFGGYPGDYYSTAYNAGYGSGGLAGRRYRDQGIVGYEFMIARTQSGPYSWWESASAPSTTTSSGAPACCRLRRGHRKLTAVRRTWRRPAPGEVT